MYTAGNHTTLASAQVALSDLVAHKLVLTVQPAEECQIRVTIPRPKLAATCVLVQWHVGTEHDYYYNDWMSSNKAARQEERPDLTDFKHHP